MRNVIDLITLLQWPLNEQRKIMSGLKIEHTAHSITVTKLMQYSATAIDQTLNYFIKYNYIQLEFDLQQKGFMGFQKCN